MLRSAILSAAAALTLTLAPTRAGAAEKTPAPASEAASTPAPAASSAPADGWLLSGATVGVGQSYLFGEIGWPGLNLSLLHGLSEKFDVGGTFSFVYGFEGVSEYRFVTTIAPGFKLNAILKLNLTTQKKFNLGLRLNPGFVTYVPTSSDLRRVLFGRTDSSAMFGIQLPLEILVGIVPISALSIHVGISMPMVLFVAPQPSFVMPFQGGFGLEYKLDSSLVLALDTRFGASIFMRSGGTPSPFSFRAQFGIGYRF